MLGRPSVLFAALAVGAVVSFAPAIARADRPESLDGERVRCVVAYESQTEKQRRADEQYEYENGEELEEGEHVHIGPPGGGGGSGTTSGGSGMSLQTVGIIVGVSGAVVGAIGGTLTAVGSLEDDKPTLIAGIVLASVGAACAITGTILGLAGSAGAQAKNGPTVHLAIGPMSGGIGGTF